MDLSNYRPISLTNVDYKIQVYVLTARLQSTFPSLIYSSQMVYLKGHFLSTNIQKVQDAINYIS